MRRYKTYWESASHYCHHTEQLYHLKLLIKQMLLLSMQLLNPLRFRGSFQSAGKHFISLIPNSSTSSDWIPNSSLPPKIASVSSLIGITANFVLWEQQISVNSLQIPLVTSKTSTDVRNFSLNPENTKMYSSFILNKFSKSKLICVTDDLPASEFRVIALY